MRVSRRMAGLAVLLPLVAACASPPRDDTPPVVTAFSDGTSPGAQARHAQETRGRRDLVECRDNRDRGVYPRERAFPCEAFLGE